MEGRALQVDLLEAGAGEVLLAEVGHTADASDVGADRRCTLLPCVGLTCPRRGVDVTGTIDTAQAALTVCSWFQEQPAASLELIGPARASTGRPALIDVGGGAARLVDCLLADGWSDITVLDVSDVALDAVPCAGRPEHLACSGSSKTCSRGTRRAGTTSGTTGPSFTSSSAKSERQQYREVMGEALAPNATIIVGTFANDGPGHCSGLPVARYDAEALVSALGATFDVLATRREEHVTPHGDTQPFTWVALRRQ